VIKLRELGCEFGRIPISVPSTPRSPDLLAEEHHWSDFSKKGHIDRWAVQAELLHGITNIG
jgi:hypothetical protein